jgi:N-carbamoylputrescine amidase
MSGRPLTLALLQLHASDDKALNVDRTVTHVRDAARRGAQLICLQELFASRYFCQTEDERHFDLAEPLDGPTLTAIARAAAESGAAVVAPVFERRAAGLYHNSLVVLGADGRQIGLYRKMHIPDDPNFYEKFYFAPGDLGFCSFDTEHVRVGPLICWDQWYPEAARLSTLGGAEILVYPTAIGWMPSEKAEYGAAQLDAWKTIQRAHAIANGVFVVSVNRVGHEGPQGAGIEFWGHSFVCDPSGVVLAEAGTDESVLIVQIDLDQIERVRRTWPFLRDRRIDAYEGITRRLIDGDP